jgi:hypothetical protein
MRIGDRSNYLSIERIATLGQNCVWHCEAGAVCAGWKVVAVHDQVLVTEWEKALQQALDFVILQIPRVEFGLSEGGWLRIRRDSRGYIVVRYRLGRLNAGAAVEGEVVLDSRKGDEFCKELTAVLSINPSSTQSAPP